jgi:photosystem II stability/assembly factor-like uncharacterized protein
MGSAILATRKGVFVLEKSGSRWDVARASFLGDNYSLATADSASGRWYAAADLGHFGVKLQRSENRGETWTEIGAPAYPPKPEDEPEKDQWGKEVPWKVLKVWALTPGHASQPNVLWCGTIPGGLFRSEDAGATWAFQQPLWDHPQRKNWFGGGADQPGIHSIITHPDRPNELILAVSCGGVWATDDGGKTWNVRGKGLRADFMPPERQYDLDIQDAHLLAVCRDEPDVMWVQHHNGIFRSTDRGMTFTDIPSMGPSVFGFAVAAHPSDPETAWFVPAIKDECRIPKDGKLVVTRTRNGGKTCEVLTDGLPQRHAYDIVFRHSLAVDDTGETLVFGTTTGSVYISENAGDSWQCVSEHLPPVHSVCWA